MGINVCSVEAAARRCDRDCAARQHRKMQCEWIAHPQHARFCRLYACAANRRNIAIDIEIDIGRSNVRHALKAGSKPAEDLPYASPFTVGPAARRAWGDAAKRVMEKWGAAPFPVEASVEFGSARSSQ